MSGVFERDSDRDKETLDVCVEVKDSVLEVETVVEMDDELVPEAESDWDTLKDTDTDTVALLVLESLLLIVTVADTEGDREIESDTLTVDVIEG